MPVLPAPLRPDPAWLGVLRQLLAGVLALQDLPQALRQNAQALAARGDAELEALAQAFLTDQATPAELAAQPLVMAALQVVYADIASRLDTQRIAYVDPASICPVCGSAPVVSVLRIGGEAGGHRYLHCGLCATEWHMVRVKCSHCESTKGVRYQGIEGGDPAVLAETCDTCHTYRKQVNQEKDPLVEPLADDLASLTLDLLMADTAYGRASGNPLLALASASPRVKTWRHRTHERQPSLDAGAALSSPAQLPAVDKLLASAALQPCWARTGSVGSPPRCGGSWTLRSRLRAGEVLAPRWPRPRPGARPSRLSCSAAGPACGRSSTSPARCCTPTWAGPCCPTRRCRPWCRP
jgi:FdhE protein